MTSTIDHATQTQGRASPAAAGRQKIGGAAALYLALALIAAMPYFLLVVDYPSATTAADKVALVVAHYGSLYAVYLASYVLFGFAVALLALTLYDRMDGHASVAVRIATAAGLLWSVALVFSGMVTTYGMTTILELHKTDGVASVQAWQAIEPVALALGGAGGELLGGLWVLLVSLVALRTGAFPKPVVWLGLLIGLVGLVSIVPALSSATIAFGLLEIFWFLSVGWVLLKSKQHSVVLP